MPTDANPPQRPDHGLTRRALLAQAATLTCLAQLPACSAETPRPNVLFVFSDAHRACSLGCYGNAQVRTPEFDRFATQGTRLTTAVSNTPQCRPYRASLMSGSYGHHTGVLSNLIAGQPVGKRASTSERNFGLDLNGQWDPGSLATLGTTFSRSGYRGGYIGKWDLGRPDIDPGPLRFGFNDSWQVWASNKHDYWNWVDTRGAGQFVPGSGQFRATHETDLALSFLRKSGSQPWFLALSWGPPHQPLEPPEEFKRGGSVQPRPNVPDKQRERLGSQVLPLYYGMIEAIDHEFGRLLAELDNLGLADNTLVIYTSDHGTMLGSQSLFGKELPHSESTHVPFLLRWPGHIPAGQVCEAPFGTPDIMPTLCGLAGLGVPSGVDGLDHSTLLLEGGKGSLREGAYLAAHEPLAVPWPGWRGVRTKRHLYARKETGPWLLFDHDDDPYEERNLVDSHPSLRRDLDELTLETMSSLGDGWRNL